MGQVLIRKARIDDIDRVKTLADAHKEELGFVLKPAVEKSIRSEELLVASNETSLELLGFVDYHHRRDEQTTLYHLVVSSKHRNQGIGTMMVAALQNEAEQQNQKSILLKCPVDLDANAFYERIGFSLIGRQNGKVRDLNIWKIDLA